MKEREKEIIDIVARAERKTTTDAFSLLERFQADYGIRNRGHRWNIG